MCRKRTLCLAVLHTARLIDYRMPISCINDSYQCFLFFLFRFPKHSDVLCYGAITYTIHAWAYFTVCTLSRPNNFRPYSRPLYCIKSFEILVCSRKTSYRHLRNVWCIDQNKRAPWRWPWRPWKTPCPPLQIWSPAVRYLRSPPDPRTEICFSCSLLFFFISERKV